MKPSITSYFKQTLIVYCQHFIKRGIHHSNIIINNIKDKWVQINYVKAVCRMTFWDGGKT
ncbi:hypothetical protein QTP88_005109 [Uroleucon formosanum]